MDKERYKVNVQDLILALDIGTRTVIGLVGVQEGEKFKILASAIKEHKSRAMLDGQVHDIEKVADIVCEVKEYLEKKVGTSLKKAAIAAAGRVLKTKQVSIEKEADPLKPIDLNIIRSMEIEAVQRAQAQLDEELLPEEKTPYYCVGYDVINYYLNNYIISSLEGHKGNLIGADVLATFLPHTVVDGLYAVLNKAGLEVESLTLEPIAAINVAIPKELRLLNLALVDIGAGTSDIAITKNGSVIAYAMAPIAGDEITELICQHFLVDFNTGEKIKIALSSNKDTISFVDIMGNKQTVKAKEVQALIQPVIEQLADTIVEKILDYNSKAPNAVFLVGGGSQIGSLPSLIANKLNLPSERVAVRKSNVIQNVKNIGKKLSGPDAITPIGIALSAQMRKGQNFINVSVNGKAVHLFYSRKLTVADALVQINYDPVKLIGRTGKSLHFTLNGEKKVLRGQYGSTAEIFVNGNAANLETEINTGDLITIKPAEPGMPAQLCIKEILEYYSHRDVKVLVNGKEVPGDYMVQDGDNIEIINNLEPKSEADALASDSKAMSVIVNGREVVLNGNKKNYIFVDIFNYIDFDLSNPRGHIFLELNGKEAAFTDTIKPGDIIRIGWK
ncbi:MAG: cell division protein FtsA [Clostridiaceae bacterium]|nr:cell division protein FtsA [Clostridiaceae bacterium]